MNINCLIVDDEPLSQDVIKDFVLACPELNLVGICKNALEAGEFIKNEKIDLLFLDINMPKLSGIGFVKSLKNPPLFIIVSAYSEFALDGFEIDAVDYLLKPVSFERFRTAVNRTIERFSDNSEPDFTAGHIMVRANKKKYRLNFDEILFLEAQGDYVKFITTDFSLMVHGTMKDFLAQLPSNQFERVHKSYVISISKVIYVEGNSVKIGESKIPVSLNYKELLLKKLG
ncbi:MAG: response regulator transcription factor [Prolixibacteraceae bacterium]|jgi:two-component system, LytTR family, response regulator|nr:response regulator transcription factor [Prolixibacteraceae bacterium]MBT6766722.1 response regulator transcription factor [Prolixibacteraceae bacterium]MBT7000613.1 response regulator transcription factor [Prolixibacteraceae bacterium]MBT7395545.1 response regulator transcription factor [Prolixibacteraceae bacterium]